MDAKKYEKPMVMTVEIPERTAYACNLGGNSCPHFSNIVNHAICTTNGGFSGAPWGGVCS